MNSEKLKDFIVPIALIVLLICGVIYYAPKIYENWQGYTNAQMEVQNKQNIIKEKKAKLEQYRTKSKLDLSNMNMSQLMTHLLIRQEVNIT